MTTSAPTRTGWRATLGTIEYSRWAVLLPMAMAALLGLIGLGDKSFWLDEAFSANIIRLPTADMLVYMFHNEQQASPYYLALQAWSVLGHDEATLRLLSVVFGVIAVLATYAVGRRFGVGLPAAMLLAVAPFFIRYEQEARVYTLLLAWSAICTLAYMRLIDRPGRWRAAVYIFAAAALIYIHPLSAWILVAHAIVTVLFAPIVWRRRLLALYVPVVITSIPMVRFLAINHSRASWIPPATIESVVRTLVALAGGAALTVAVALVIALALGRELPALRLPALRLSALRLAALRLAAPRLSAPTLLVLWLALPLGGILFMSLVTQPLWVDRYLIGVVPALVIVIASAIKAVRWRWVILGTLIALSLVGVNSWYANGTKDDWRAAAAYVEAQAQATDGVIIWPNYYRLPFSYYAAVGEPLYPSTPWSELYMPFLGMKIDLPAEVHNERIWLVRNVSFLPSGEIAALLEQYETVETRVFGETQPEIDLLVRRVAP